MAELSGQLDLVRRAIRSRVRRSEAGAATAPPIQRKHASIQSLLPIGGEQLTFRVLPLSTVILKCAWIVTDSTNR